MTRRGMVLSFAIFFLLGASDSFSATHKQRGTPRIEASTRTGQSYKISFEEMERQMTSLTRGAAVEDSWIYVVEDEMLYDVGLENQAHFVGTDLSKIESGEINIRGKHVVDIHIHAWKEHTSRDFLPSSTPDLHVKAGHTDPVYRKFGAVGIRTLAYDGHGVWESRMSKDFETSTSRCGDEALLDKVDNFKEKIRGDSPEERARVVKRYISRCKAVGLEMTYKSLE